MFATIDVEVVQRAKHRTVGDVGAKAVLMLFACDWSGPGRVYALSDLAAVTELDAGAVTTALALLQTAGLVTTVTAAGQVTVRSLTV